MRTECFGQHDAKLFIETTGPLGVRTGRVVAGRIVALVVAEFCVFAFPDTDIIETEAVGLTAGAGRETSEGVARRIGAGGRSAHASAEFRIEIDATFLLGKAAGLYGLTTWVGIAHRFGALEIPLLRHAF